MSQIQISDVLGTTRQDVIVVPRFKVNCPHAGCTGTHDFTHLIEDAKGEPVRWGPWYCSECGKAARATDVTTAGALVEAMSEQKVRTLVLLACIGTRIQEDQLYVVTEGMAFKKDGVVDITHEKYFYEEHLCPSHFMKAEVLVGNDTDPHGIFRHIETVITPSDWEDKQREIEDYQSLFVALRNTRLEAKQMLLPAIARPELEVPVRINGVRLTESQAMVVRVGLSSFVNTIKEICPDETGSLYHARGKEVLAMMRVLDKAI